MSELRLRLDSFDGFFRRVRKDARRIDAGDVSALAPSVSFASADHLFATLTPNRWVLLGRLRQLGPSSIRALAKSLDRDYRGVHSDVTALLEVGLIERDADRKVLVPWSRITAELLLDESA